MAGKEQEKKLNPALAGLGDLTPQAASEGAGKAEVEQLFQSLGFERTNINEHRNEEDSINEFGYAGRDAAGNWIKLEISDGARPVAGADTVSFDSRTAEGKFIRVRIAKEQDAL